MASASAVGDQSNIGITSSLLQKVYKDEAITAQTVESLPLHTEKDK